MSFNCSVCEFRSESYRGLATHTSKMHERVFTDEEKKEIIANASLDSGSAITGMASIDEAAGLAPQTEAYTETQEATATSVKKIKKQRTKKEIAPSEDDLRLEAMKKIVGDACGKLTIGIIRGKWKDFPELSMEEERGLQEGWNSFFDAIGIRFDIKKYDYVLTSPWAMLLMPLFALLTIMAGHLDFVKGKFDEAKHKGNRDHSSKRDGQDNSGSRTPDENLREFSHSDIRS